MAELKLTIKADLKKLKSDVQSLLKKKFNIGVKGGDGADNPATKKEQKNQTGEIAKGVGIIAAIAGILKGVQPVLDFIKIGISFAAFWIMKIGKFFLGGGIGRIFKSIENKVAEVVFNLGLKIIEFKNRLIERVKELKNNIVEKVKELKDKFIDKVRELKDRLVAKFDELKERFVNKIVELKNKFVSKIIELKDRLIASLTFLKEGIEEKLEPIKEKIKEWVDIAKEKFDVLKDKLVAIKDKILDLPGLIWDKIKGLAQMIADKIKGILPGIFGGGDRVGDAIIKPNGQVIRTDPNDTLIATKNPEGIGGSKTFNFFGVTPQEMIDVIERELGTRLNNSGRF